MLQTGILKHEEIYDVFELEVLKYEKTPTTEKSLKLLELSRESEGLTGRTLRKIPFLAHALYLNTDRTTLSAFLKAMHSAVRKQNEANGFQ